MYTCRGQFPEWPLVYSASSFSVTGAGTVVDSRTGLEWQRDLPAQYLSCSGMAKMPGDRCAWAEAKSYCMQLSLAGSAWRLPSKAELESLIDDTNAPPAIDTTTFPDMPELQTPFWTSTTRYRTDATFVVDFHMANRAPTATVRCSFAVCEARPHWSRRSAPEVRPATGTRFQLRVSCVTVIPTWLGSACRTQPYIERKAPLLTTAVV
jgi:Protein of unknown function (DUF1566)